LAPARIRGIKFFWPGAKVYFFAQPPEQGIKYSYFSRNGCNGSAWREKHTIFTLRKFFREYNPSAVDLLGWVIVLEKMAHFSSKRKLFEGA
jgi:hypothetical protein